MALLNKLFFPSSTSTTSSAAVPAAALVTPSSSTQQKPTNNLSRTSSLASILSSSGGTAATAAANSQTSSLSLQRNIVGKCGGSNKKNIYNQTTHSKNYLSQFPFDGSQVRILVYRECDSRGRRLLFDSNALEKVYLKKDNGSKKHNLKSTTGGHSAANSTSNHNNNYKETKDFNSAQQASNKGHSNGSFIEVCEEFGYKHNRPNSSDISSVGEMVFGALAMSFRGTSLKVHWLEGPSRVLCSQVFLTPTKQINGQSPYSTISTNSLMTPRSSICSDHGSMDGVSMNSFSLPYSIGVGRHKSLTPSDLSSSIVSSPLDVPSVDQQSLLTNNESATDSGPRFSSTYSTGNDSGYSALSRGQLSSDQWSASYQYSTRSSLGSITSESERIRKFSMDSNFFGSSSTGSSNILELSSDSSLQRRISRNVMTSFENENSMNDLIGYVTDNCSNVAVTSTIHGGSEGINLAVNNPRPNCCSSESRSNPEMGKRRECGNSLKSNFRRARLGLAVCITMSESFEEEMELFCSEHIALVESMLSRLRASTERAYLHHSHFLQIMFQNWQDTQQWFLDLFTAPRIKCPVWLNITTSGSKYSKNVAERFIKELCWLLSFADTKDTNFFVSTMLTAILTHHLGWVPTVSPFNSSSSTAAIEQRAKLLKVSQKHPYNALWAQMGDLFGAIGLPPKLTRTVIYGTEKLSVERLLNVLTYFIRCGEVRRSSKKEDFSKEKLKDILAQKRNEPLKKTTKYVRKSSLLQQNRSEGILLRTSSCKQNLSSIIDDVDDEMSQRNKEEDDEDGDEYEYDNTLTDEAIRTNKMNEIPTVLAFRDSHFVQQELRIGNYLMDTGIEKNSIQQYQHLKQKDSRNNRKHEGQIRLTLTTPENIELNVGDSHLDEDGAMEAIEIEPMQNESTNYCKSQDNKNSLEKKPFFWGITSSTVEEGLSLNDLNKSQQCFNKKQQDNSLQQQDKKYQQLSLSDLITQNSMGKSERMTWGIEPIKENLCLEEKIHFELSQKNIERDHGICMSKENKSASAGGVLFVLGENEPLVNIKKSNEDLRQTEPNESPALSLTNSQQDTTNNQLLCPHHQQMHNSVTSSHQQLSKKHSGVKFNFEQYPQIVTNYMKSKNLLMTNYDLLMDKCSKLEMQAGVGSLISTHFDKSPTMALIAKQDPKAGTNKNTFFPQISATATTATTTTMPPNNVCSNCMVCNGLLNAYQTPSNATELEFETDEIHSFTNVNISTNANTTAALSATSLPTVSSQTSVQTLISSNSHSGQVDACVNDLTISKNTIDSSGCGCSYEIERNESNSLTSPKEVRKKQFNAIQKKPLSQRCSISSVAAKCAAVNESIHLLKLPIPNIKEMPQEDEPPGDMKLPVGFVPSLFLSVNDHYIPDMVLQGTLASPKKWEMNLREDLALAAHSASLISLPAENIAIIADLENWDVKLLSSQSQHFPYAGGQSAPVGMSQLVSTMLETVQTMNSAGISAYECLSFMESKLQEIYLHSETLAAFLLETDFCSLSAVTTALNLSENDVPLLLSIASIHTPQISKKCGISFR